MKNKLLNEGRWLDTAVVYRLGKKFILPFNKWKAFKLGLIDAKGRRTKKKVKTTEEKNSYTLLDRMIRKIRVFVGDSKFGRMTLAYLLLTEDEDMFPKYSSLLVEQEDGARQVIDLGETESVVLRYEDKINEIDFFVLSKLGDSITSTFGGTIPKKGNEDLLKKLDNSFSNILNKGYDEFMIVDKEGTPTKVAINYSDSELSIETVTKDGIQLGKFFTVFETIDKANHFVDAWQKFKENT